jgi:hypothetical protein
MTLKADQQVQPNTVTSQPKPAKTFPSIEHETRSHVGTACAAFWLNRNPQTLRGWASYENGPLRPTRVNGRLAWSVATIRSLLNGGAA